MRRAPPLVARLLPEIVSPPRDWLRYRARRSSGLPQRACRQFNGLESNGRVSATVKAILICWQKGTGLGGGGAPTSCLNPACEVSGDWESEPIARSTFEARPLLLANQECPHYCAASQVPCHCTRRASG